MREFVEYRLRDLYFAVDIMTVQEILMPPSEVVPVPKAPSYVKGLLDLRGTVIPIIDMRLKLGMEESPLTKKSRVIIARAGKRPVGLLVDEASRIIRVEDEMVQEVPDVIKEFPQSHYVKGVIRENGKLILLLDLERVLIEKAIIDIGEIGEELISKKKKKR